MWQDLYHCLGIFLGIIGQNPSVSKLNLLQDVIFLIINLRYISLIPLK
jgi:hypothetical protein